MPQSLRQTLVNSIVLSTLDHCDPVWFNCSKGSKDRLQQIHHRAAKIVLGVKNRYSSEAAMEKLKWKSLEERRQLHLAIEVFKAQRKTSPKYLSDLFIQKETVHSHNTRSQLHRDRISSSHGSNAFSIVGPKLWENLPSKLKETGFVKSFKTQLLSCLPLCL
jgi:hypothetical protein